MAWKIELTPTAIRDQRRIFAHLVETHHRSFGKSVREARDLAANRLREINVNAKRIAQAPHIGTRRTLRGMEFRTLTIDRAIYWFTLNEPAETVQIEGIFFSGQDHLGRMLSRLTAEDGGAI